MMENATQITKKFFATIRENEEIAKQTANEFGIEFKLNTNEVEGKGKVTAFCGMYKETGNKFLATECDFKEGYNVLLYCDNVEIIHNEPFFLANDNVKPMLAFFKDFVKVFEINKTL